LTRPAWRQHTRGMALRAPLLLLAVGVACTADPPPPSILVVTWDTVRADRVGDPAVTPTWATLAAEGTVFADARTTAPLTLPAHASLLTGLQPPNHGARSNGWFTLDEGLTTWPEQAAQAGWRTGAFVSAAVLARRYGLAQGFQVYDDAVGTAADSRYFAERRADATVDAAMGWLAQVPPREPVVLWVHLFDPHRPWQSPLPGFESRPYDGEIAWTDQQTGRLLAAWASSGRQERSVVVVTSDHGEGLGEHGESTHGFFAYDSTVRIPLVIRVGEQVAPTAKGQTVGGPASLVDLAPTLAELAGLPALPGQGRSLVSSLSSGAPVPPRELAFEAVSGALEYGTAPVFGVVDEGGDTWFELPRREWYAAADRDQLVDRYDPTQEDRADGLFARHPRAWPPPSLGATPESEELARLEALGYLEAAPVMAGDAPDPKDALDLIRLNQGSAPELTPAGALARVQELAQAWGATPVIVALQVDLLDQLGRVSDGDAVLAAQAETRPDTAQELEARRAQRVADQALAVRIAAARAAHPDQAGPAFDHGVVLRRLGDLPQAALAWEETLRLDPADEEARRELARLRVAQGALGAARELLAPAVEAPGEHPLLVCDAARLHAHALGEGEQAAKLLRACEAVGGELSVVERGWVGGE